MDGLITSYFKKAPKPPQRGSSDSKKRRKASRDDTKDDDTPTNALKRSKLAGASPKHTPIGLPTQTSGSSNSKLPQPDVITISSEDSTENDTGLEPCQRLETKHELATPRPQSASNPATLPRTGRKPKSALRQDSIVPATPEHPPPLSSTAFLTPIPFRGLSQTFSDDSVGSSQSQEYEEFDDPFQAPRKADASSSPHSSKAAFGSSELDVTRGQLGEVLASPKMIDSSQSQYMSMYGPLSPFRLNKRMTLLLDDELVPSSQSQENELGMSQLLPLERYALLLLSFLYLADSIPQNPFSAEEKLIPFS